MRWVIGDIHGMFAALEKLLDALLKIDSQAKFYFVGDYVNRGPESRRVIDFLLTLKNARYCRGNHDDVFDLIVNGHWLGGEENAYEPLAACVWFLRHGLAETILSYGVRPDDLDYHRYHPSNVLIDLVRSAVPQAHKKFLADLPMQIDDDDALIMHAFWPPEEPNDRAHIKRRLADAETRHRVVWERFRPAQITMDKPWTRPMFFGHTPVTNYPLPLRQQENRPIVSSMITLLDTALVLGLEGRISAVCIEDGSVVMIDRGLKVIA